MKKGRKMSIKPSQNECEFTEMDKHFVAYDWNL